MKKLFFLTIIFFVTMSFTDKPISTNKELVKPWWKIALVDAGGALGGAGSVASLGGGACPPCLAAGGIIGAASASVGYAGLIVPTGSGGEPNNPENIYDYVGSKHNELVVDFLNLNHDINATNYFNYISKNKDKYGVETMYLTEDFFKNQLEKVNSLEAGNDILDFIGDNLPTSVNKENFRAELLKLTNSSDIESFISQVKSFENQFFEENTLEQKDLVIMKSFFSTLRYSANIW